MQLRPAGPRGFSISGKEGRPERPLFRARISLSYWDFVCSTLADEHPQRVRRARKRHIPTSNGDIPTFAELEADHEIAALLEFEPVPRAVLVEGSWTPQLRRELVARIAVHGSIQQACDEMGKNRTGVTRLKKHKRAAGLCTAIDGAIALARRRLAEVDALIERMEPATRPAIVDYRRKRPLEPAPGAPLPTHYRGR